MAPLKHSPYRQLLLEAIAEKVGKNPRYSLRALAKSVDLAHSQLSRVLNGKKNLSLFSAQVIAEKLFSDRKKRDEFLAWTEFEIARKPKQKQRAEERLRKIKTSSPERQLKIDELDAFRKWYDFAILDLVGIPGINENPRSIATYLGIPLIQVRESLDRLMRAGLLKSHKVSNANRLVKTSPHLLSSHNIPNERIRALHFQWLARAQEALESLPIERRHFQTLTLSLDKNALSEIHEAAEQFMEKVRSVSNASARASNLYQVQLQCFDLSAP